ncbi:MAG: glycosyltransferase family 2 protein [Muribaculum sp.]|nr:glycosyltransferase family 2 protein [Muribaculum sp.]
MKRIAALLTVHNRKEKTLRCLRELFSQELPDDFSLSVYLTDDGCTDGTPEAIRQEFPEVHIVKGDGNLFWNRGMHAAWAEAEKNDYDFYLWLNDDTYLLNGCIKQLIEKSSEYNDESIIIGQSLDSTQVNVTYGGWGQKGLIKNRDTQERIITFNGNIVLIPKSIYAILGKNDPYYHHTLGDLDYGLRATEKGIEIFQCKEPCGICDQHDTIAKWKDPNQPLIRRIKYLYSTGGNGSNPFEQFHFRKKHYGRIAALTIFVSSHIHAIFPQLWKI